MVRRSTKKEMTAEDLEHLYQEAAKAAVLPLDGLPATMKMWVLFRIAMEYSSAALGVSRMNYFMSRLLAESLGIVDGDPDAGFHRALTPFDEEEETPH